MERTRQMIEGFFRLPMLRIFRTIRVVILRGAHLEVTVKSPLPVLGPWGFPDSIEVKGHAIYAEHRSGD